MHWSKELPPPYYITRFIYHKYLVYCFEGLDYLVQFYDIWVIKAHQDFYLSLNTSDLFFSQLGLFIYFHCNFSFVIPIHCATD